MSGFSLSVLLHFWEDKQAVNIPLGTKKDGLDKKLEELLFSAHQVVMLDDESTSLKLSEQEPDSLMDRFVTEAEVLQYAEEKTHGQATNKLWFDLHRGRITSSKFSQVLRHREST